MSLFDADNSLTILRVERLAEPPRDPGEDRVWWEADIADDDEGPLTLQLWVTGTDAVRVPEGEEDGWIREEVQKLWQMHEDVAVLYALSPIQLHPPLS